MTPAETAVAKIKRYCSAQRKLLEGVTEGPWEAKGKFSPLVSGPGGGGVAQVNAFGDDTFIASARSSVPALLSALERLIALWEMHKAAGEPMDDYGRGFDSAHEAAFSALASSLPPEPEQEEG